MDGNPVDTSSLYGKLPKGVPMGYSILFLSLSLAGPFFLLLLEKPIPLKLLAIFLWISAFLFLLYFFQVVVSPSLPLSFLLPALLLAGWITVPFFGKEKGSLFLSGVEVTLTLLYLLFHLKWVRI
jgi:hypothetical protein